MKRSDGWRNERDKKRVLVTGASGFIGANLTRKLLSEGAEVHVLLRTWKDNWRISTILPKLKVHNVDLLNEEELKKVISSVKPQIIFHCATYGAYPSAQKDADLMIKTNITATKNLIMSAIDAGCERFINTGSSSEYGIKNAPMKETDSLEPANMYGVTKAAQTLLVTQIAKEKGIQAITLRLFSPYGPYEEETRLIPTILLKKIRGEQANLGSSASVRDFIYVDDVIDAYVRAATETYKPGIIVNIGSGTQTSTGQLTKLLKIKPAWNSHASSQTEPKVWQANISRAWSILGWKPTTQLKSGLLKNTAWLKKKYGRDYK
jgi:nucleoside-diphosphate-sugar epimerase